MAPVESAAGTEGRPAGAARFVASAAALFLAAIVLGRFLIDRNDLWPLFLLALPGVLIVLSLAFGFLRAVFLVALFACTAMTFGWLVRIPNAGWAVLLLAPMVLLATFVALRVVRVLLAERRGGVPLASQGTAPPGAQESEEKVGEEKMGEKIGEGKEEH